ncbi:universal stress protein [Microvirga sp. STR05]|uniref:Universal stress protein n=1 Tax=Hymenobacter duratus TaxID=2771356 RepID=A0ABR8JG60_9BACT|nr:universal stress protein [Hymenobacter duratus]MBD2714556.1 universal stress protein [Hymenobacter duratus]MBR7949460.1 universal stress protein [Microvirga sp. STR05]
MNQAILMLTNLSAAAERAAQMAAVLGLPLQLRLVLLHLYHDPLLDPELVVITTAGAYRTQAETNASLQAMAQRLALPTEVTTSADTLREAVQAALQHYHPLLLGMGLSQEHDLLDRLLHNQMLPVLRATGYPLLLVPERGPVPQVPRRVALAVDAESFSPNRASQALAPLLASWQAAYTVVHVAAPKEQEAFAGQRALTNVRQSKLLPAATRLELYQEREVRPAAGVLQALEDTQADLLLLVARPRSFMGRFFHHSVTMEVLRHCRIPVLLLPAHAPAVPGWMPAMS